MSNPLAHRARRGEKDFYCSGSRRGENEPRDMRADSAGARRFGNSKVQRDLMALRQAAAAALRFQAADGSAVHLMQKARLCACARLNF
ncbi:hypothetical protein [Solimonas variicoloris]|uniref:hypothetical protein n=1 Tax=Solimonas variicoloris TaxID=254408 RepID=UPI0012B570C7|nr:hypothetical protein [Solimonas variicoloris]